MAEALEAHLAHPRESGRPVPDRHTDTGESPPSLASPGPARAALPATASTSATSLPRLRTAREAAARPMDPMWRGPVPSLSHGADVRRHDTPSSVIADPGAGVAHATRDLRPMDAPSHPEHDERHCDVVEHFHMSLYLVQLVNDEHAGAVGCEIAGLVDHLPVRTDARAAQDEGGAPAPVRRQPASPLVGLAPRSGPPAPAPRYSHVERTGAERRWTASGPLAGVLPMLSLIVQYGARRATVVARDPSALAPCSFGGVVGLMPSSA